MSAQTQKLIEETTSLIRQLLYDEVINTTIRVMLNLGKVLGQLTYSKVEVEALDKNQKDELVEILLQLTSESIREALHKGELSITNGIIRSKNQILGMLGEKIPNSHKEIDPEDYPTYSW